MRYYCKKILDLFYEIFLLYHSELVSQDQSSNEGYYIFHIADQKDEYEDLKDQRSSNISLGIVFIYP
jgi:hypothetical protein